MIIRQGNLRVYMSGRVSWNFAYFDYEMLDRNCEDRKMLTIINASLGTGAAVARNLLLFKLNQVFSLFICCTYCHHPLTIIQITQDIKI